MQCLICSPFSLQQVMLEEHLVAYQCHKCAGIFISSTNYWAWLDSHPRRSMLYAYLSAEDPYK